jgi:hypothetical protein
MLNDFFAIVVLLKLTKLVSYESTDTTGSTVAGDENEIIRVKCR